ncbi:glycerol-3-phosphate dehydrogenase/oxidase [candidate division KSB1 bacterium]|nr:glycerol-3-phosphate dehydrogenase/oxidase [candidate division KSB1 bacterium]RQW06261.1 MAG: glycerol-3-phosphate dehydrogenase/oxidase [candidate division KSB1 bacterium]
MRREQSIDIIRSSDDFWDVVVIGGGATGLGAAVEAASRGYKTVLLEQHDFSKGTSSRSTKLVHGGVRYLQQGNVSLVLEALRERGLLVQNAPHLVRNQAFIVPSYDWWEGPFYGIGLKLYDMLAGKLGLGPSKWLSKEETKKRIPTLEPGGLLGGIAYYDGQFDDSRLAINLAQTLADLGGTPVNYVRVVGLLKAGEVINGVIAQDMERGDEMKIFGRVVINATGVFVDNLLKMDDPHADSIISPSQGVHIILDKEFLPGESAIMVPHTDDGRVLFAVPWRDRVVVGTTDTPVDQVSLEPRPLQEEIDFILTHAARYLTKDPVPSDALSVFAGLRPLVKATGGKSTAALSRDHLIMISKSGLITITGGKWTTYRKMGQDVINQAALVAGLEERPCKSEEMRIHGWLKNYDLHDPLHYYGSDALGIQKLQREEAKLARPLHANLPYTAAEVIWAVREEMARTVEDVLSRRLRALLLDARASIEMAPAVAKLMASEMKMNKKWQKEQVKAYTSLAQEYLLS